MLCMACSKDDETSNNNVPTVNRYLSKVTDDNGNTIVSLSYYDDKKIKTVENNSFSYHYIYNTNGTVATIITSLGNEPVENNYSYTNGKISSYTYNGVDVPVVYDAAENSYTYTILNNVPAKAFFDENDNLIKTVIDKKTYHFLYDTKYKGPLNNSNNLSLTNYICNFPMLLPCEISYNITRIPFESMVGDITFKYNNEYDTENFLTKSIIKSTSKGDNGEPQTFESIYTYQYIQL